MLGLNSLVADYSDSSDEEPTNNPNPSSVHVTEPKNVEIDKPLPSVNFFESPTADVSLDEETTLKKKKKKKSKLKKEKALPKPFGRIIAESSVFSTPFQKEQMEKQHHLEKHVKLTTHSKDMQEINGKKICLSYRKGRCRFGHQCKFAHDSDLIGYKPSAEDTVVESGTAGELYNMKANERHQEAETSSRKRKPGLNNSFMPPKKSRSNFHLQQKNETPWLNKG